MWKSIAWLMLVYGLFATAVAVDAGDKQRGMGAMYTGWQRNYEALKQRMERNGIQPPPVARFTGHDPLAACSANAMLEAQSDGNMAWLDWNPDRSTAKLDLLAIMLSPGPPEANALQLRMRANYEGQLVIGVMEEDGSSYVVFPERIGTDWTDYQIPLGVLTLSEESEDENGQLDMDQIESVLLGYLELPAAGPQDPEVRVISIAEVLFRPVHDNPLFPDFRPGQRRQDGPSPGRPGMQRPRGEMRERMKERIEGSQTGE